MGYKEINFGILILLIIFVLGILFASSYTSNKTKLATLTLEKNHNHSSEMAQSISNVKGIKTVFLDDKSQLLTFRYDNSQLSLNQIKNRLKQQGYNVKNLYTFKILPLKRNTSMASSKSDLVRFNFGSISDPNQ